MAYHLEDYSWLELERKRKEARNTIIIPIGSIEQHGKHLPLGTDSFVAISLAEQGSTKTGALMAPPIWAGWSPHHMVLPGTITIRTEVLIELLYDTVESLARHGFKNFVLINGHRIVNVIWMQIASQKIQEKYDVDIKIFDPAYMSKSLIDKLEFGPLGHAEEIETSHMLHIKPELVNMELAEDNPIKATDFYSVDPRYLEDTLCYVPTTYKTAAKSAEKTGGSHGEPSKSDAGKGALYNDHLVERLVQVIQKMQGVDFDES